MRKITTGIGLLLVGFLVGALAFYATGRYGLLPARVPQPFASMPDRQKAEPGAFSRIVRNVSPSVVNIAASRKRGEAELEDLLDEFLKPFDGFEGKNSEQSLGSGVIVSEDGFIVTNNHVIEDTYDIRVTLFDKRTYKGKVIGTDPKTDLAIMKIEAAGLPVLPWGDSDNLEVGEFVLAIGNPFSLSHTVTMGIISAVGRANVGIADYEDFIQTDAAINPGNSGGPLVNARGEVIGINTAIFSQSGGYQGIGFAVPSNMARMIKEQLQKEGRVVRGWLGVTIQELTPEMALKFGSEKPTGALVSDTVKGSPAHKAGIRRGDIITGFNGKPVEDPSSFKNMVAQARPGTRVAVDLLRDKAMLGVAAVVGELPAEFTRKQSDEVTGKAPGGSLFAGLKVAELTRDIMRQLGLGAEEKGVVIIGVDELSPAGEAGLKRGDIIEEIERKPLAGVRDFNAAVSSAPKPGEPVILLANRMGRRFFVSLKPD